MLDRGVPDPVCSTVNEDTIFALSPFRTLAFADSSAASARNSQPLPGLGYSQTVVAGSVIGPGKPGPSQYGNR
jgi:hypothetical protein